MQPLLPFDDAVLCSLPAPLPLDRARRALVLAPHPDDEVIGCGGLIVALLRLQVPVHVVLVTDGSGAGGLSAIEAARRPDEFRAAAQRLGASSLALLGLPDGALTTGVELDTALLRQVRDFAPNWLIAPTVHDAHRDHRRVAEAARQAALAVPSVEWLLSYETWSPLTPTHVLDISEHLDTKLAALAEHRTALAHGNYLAATEGLCRYRALLLGAPKPRGAAEVFSISDRPRQFAA